MTCATLVGTDRAIALAVTARPEAAGTMACPARLASEQSANAPSGWTAQRSARDAPLEAIALYDGPPADRVELAPAADRRAGGWHLAQWRFGPDVRPTIACRYRGTDIVLVRALPATVRQCSLRTRAGTGLVEPTALRCA